MKSIVLIGMPGSGKTSIAKALALKFGMNSCDTDHVIERNEKLSIAEIFASKGETYFRKIEADVALNLPKENFVISLGGGTFENSDVRLYLLENMHVIYLDTSPENILNRVKNSDSRPLLTNNMNLERICELLNKRAKHYKLAHYTVLTDNKSPEEICGEVLKCLK